MRFIIPMDSPFELLLTSYYQINWDVKLQSLEM